MKESIDQAVAAVKPALVRVEVVSAYYSRGRKQRYPSSGSGVIITAEGHVVTNHHVAGHATRLKCTLPNKEEIEAELVGRDPLTDIAVLQLKPEEPRTFPVARFGDSSQVRVGDHVLAMGSPMALSQSVTIGIISNIELVMPNWIRSGGGLTQDGEDVGALVRWFGHDAQIYPGNSGGPLVNMQGEVIGVNEIEIGLGGAIPGNLANEVARELIASGEVKRAWLGVRFQPRFKHLDKAAGIVVGSVIPESPAAQAGFKAGDLLTQLAGNAVDVRFYEQMPAFNQMVAALPRGESVEAVVLRNGDEKTLTVTPEEREKFLPQEHEFRQWGATGRDLSFLLAREMKRDSRDGVLVTSLQPGGPAAEAKPGIEPDDVIMKAGGKAVANVKEFREVTRELTEGAEEPVPVLVEYERKTRQLVTVVEVGTEELQDPGLEVKKAWLPVETQVVTRDIAEEIERPELTGFRVTKVYRGSTAEKAGVKTGDFIVAVDGEKLTASAPEDYDQLFEWIRQYRIGSTAELSVMRGGEELTIPVELVRAPRLSREMRKYRDELFEFTVRNVTFFDKAEEKWAESQRGVVVQEVVSGGWAALGMLESGDLLVAVNENPVTDVEALEKEMDTVAKEKPDAVIFKVLRGIYTAFLEIEPKWDESENDKEEK